MADTGRACAEHLALLLKTKAALRKSVPAIAVPDSDQLAMHQRPADQGHLREAGGARERRGADAVLCAGLSGRRFRRLRAERLRLWQDAGRCRCRGRHDRQRSSRATRTISTARSTRPTTACATRWSWRRPRPGRSSSPTPRTIPAPAAIPTPRACCARWCATTRQRAATGVIYDPESARAAHAAGVGATVTLALGGKSGIPGDAPYQGNLRRRKTVRRQVRRARSLLRRPRHGHGPVGVPAHRRRPRGRRLAQGAARRSGDVPLCRHRADRADDPRQQELGAFPRRFRADRRKAADLRRARRDAGRYRDLPWTRLRPGIRIKPNGPPSPPPPNTLNVFSTG